jgi:NADH-quinone oxidoreductase subunit E
MQRYDLRDLHENFYDRMGELIESGLKVGEVGIFLFEVGNFNSIQKSADFIRDSGHDLMNSLKFNEVDWTIVVKKVSNDEIAKRKEALQKAVKLAEEKRIEAQRIAKAKAEAKAKADAEKKEAEEKAKAEAKAKKEAEEKAKAEVKAKKEAEEKAKIESEVKKAPAKKAPAKKAPVRRTRAKKASTKPKAK